MTLRKGGAPTTTATCGTRWSRPLRNWPRRAARAVVLREAARRVGVSPTAAYRHYSSQGELLEAVKALCQQALADSMEAFAHGAGAAFGAEDARSLDGDAAVRRVEAMGRGYVRWAIENPGLFRTAFMPVTPTRPASTSSTGCPPARGGVPGFARLTEALDALLATGRMRPENRPNAEAAAWAPVHGLALLVLDGPFGGLEPAVLDAVVDQVLATTVAGLVRQAPPARSAVRRQAGLAPPRAPDHPGHMWFVRSARRGYRAAGRAGCRASGCAAPGARPSSGTRPSRAWRGGRAWRRSARRS
ncbi:WHG domain-containing protein [Streptomyces sp. M19]